MALVFKIKFQDTLRRWVVTEDFNSSPFSLAFSQLEDKIRDLFYLSQTTSFVLTYVDKDQDLVTLGDDQDLADACLIQQLNPLRLDVHEKLSVREPTTKSLMGFMEDGNMESLMKALPPDTAAAGNQNIVRTSSQVLDLKHRSGFVLGNLRNIAGGALSESLRSVLSHKLALPNHRRDNAHYVFHRGIQCDGCGMNPIEGPRYKSKKVPNFDLCLSCFDLMGINTDFHKLDYPDSSFQRGVGFYFLSLKDCLLRAVSLQPTLRPSYAPECPFSGQAMDFRPFNEPYNNFDARFIEDVTIMDGTELEPGTKFTKAWVMQNNGILPWPQGTQLAHVGGTALSSMEVANLELPEGGLPCGQDVVISVELEAPNGAGRYVSHWRLVLKSGQFFGHTVWVVIQVLEKSNIEGQEMGEANPEMGVAILEREILSSPGMPNGSLSNPLVLPEEENKSFALENEADIELDGFSLVEMPVESSRVVSAEKEIPEIDLEAQMKSLETMGFEDRDSNPFWLQKSDTDMQSAPKDVLIDAAWEDRIRNLEDMGFKDETTNIRLLQKYKGSIKQVVKDLVKIENEEKGKYTPQVSRSVA